jgi:quercetin dioxygenase-like cupin family protein
VVAGSSPAGSTFWYFWHFFVTQNHTSLRCDFLFLYPSACRGAVRFFGGLWVKCLIFTTNPSAKLPIFVPIFHKNPSFMQRRKFLASALAATATSTLAQPIQPDKPQPFVVKKGQARFGVHTPYRGINPNDIKISGKDTQGQLAVFEYLGHEKIGPDLHIHYDQDEFFQIISGEFLFQVGEEKFRASAGDLVFAPRNIPHTWVQLSEHSHLVYGVQPAGKMEDFFLKMSNLQGPPTFEQVQQIHQDHGMKILGKGLSAKE